MHEKRLQQLQQNHDFSHQHREGEQRTRYVLWLTAVTMLIEIVAGSLYGSMALLADGWHMSTHVAAFLIALFAYRFERQHAYNPRFSFGTGKVNALGGFTSAVALSVVAFMMLIESLYRLIEPHVIRYEEAIVVALLGLLVNVASALLLKEHHSTHQHDHNLHSAYTHILADALTSVLAIIALFAGKLLNWSFLDPFMGIVGAIIIALWSVALIRSTYPLLLDNSIEAPIKADIIDAIETQDDNRISDLHIWKVGADDYAAIISIVTHEPKAAEEYKALLKTFTMLKHITIEVNRCEEECR